jgi:SagB-type dehydrogenase family enzyme
MTVQRRPDWLVALRRDAHLVAADDGSLSIQGARRMLPLASLGEALAAAVKALAERPRSDAELTELAMGVGGASAALRVQLLLTKLGQAGWLEYSLVDGGTPLAVLVPVGYASVRMDPSALVPAPPMRLSRFAVARAEGGRLRIESPLSQAAVELIDPRCAQLLAALAAGVTIQDAAAQLPDLSADILASLLAMMNAAGLLSPADPAADPESSERRLEQWSPADLALHRVSRFGRPEAGYGGTYRFAGRFAALPAQEPRSPMEVVVLDVPDLAQIAARDPSLTQVLEGRRSLRKHDDTAPLTAAQLGELLYRTVRIRQVTPSGDDELVDRPFPAGGSLAELEVYPVVTHCAGLSAGVWHYDGLRHALEKICEPTPAMTELVAQARVTSLMDSSPQVLLVIAARFGRVMWKYESMAYALILKHVGVLYQSLYLTATAMGLAPCAQGGGNAELFAAASGLEYYTEGSVGEFVVGSAATDARSMWEAAKA